MKLLKYSKFLGLSPINENLDGAKKLLRDTYKINRAVVEVSKDFKVDPSGLFLFNKDGEQFKFSQLPDEVKNNARQKFREIKVTPEETKAVERCKLLQKVRELIGDKLGFAHLFTYLILVENVSFDDIKEVLAKLIEYKDLLNVKNPVDGKPLLRRPIGTYIDPNIPNNYENLIDDFENILLYKSTRKVYNELTPKLKADYEKQPPVIKKQVDDLALAFSKLGMEDGKVNKVTQEKLWKLFFGELKTLQEDTEIRGRFYRKGDKVYSGQMVRFENIRDFIKSAQNYLKNIDNTETVKFYESIERCNLKYGNYGVQVCFDESNILILEIKSFQANQMMNSHTRHCIKDSLYQWDHYVGSDNNYNKQYYIYNFNLPSYDTKSVIGITIGPRQQITACHLKDDSGFSQNFKPLLKSWEKEYGIDDDLWKYFASMTDKEIDEKRRRVVANREIVKKGLSLEQIKKYLVEDGADVNTQRGQALDNAISEVNAEKVKYLLDFGASPNMRQKQEASVNKISDIEDSTVAFEILKYMLNAGAELTPTVFKGLLGDYNAVKFCLDNGLDPNFEDNLAIRLSIKKGLFDVFKLLVDKGAVIANRGLNIAWAYESGNRDILEFLIEKGYTQNIDKSMAWIGHSPKLSIEKRIEILKELQDFIDAGKVIPSENGYRINDGKDLRRNVSYKDVIDKYGNLFNWVVAQNPDTLGAKLKKR